MINCVTAIIVLRRHRKDAMVRTILCKDTVVQMVGVYEAEGSLVDRNRFVQLLDEELSVIDIPLKRHRIKLSLIYFLHGLVLACEEQKGSDRGNRTCQCEEAREQGTEACPCSVVV